MMKDDANSPKPRIWLNPRGVYVEDLFSSGQNENIPAQDPIWQYSSTTRTSSTIA